MDPEQEFADKFIEKLKLRSKYDKSIIVDLDRIVRLFNNSLKESDFGYFQIYAREDCDDDCADGADGADGGDGADVKIHMGTELTIKTIDKSRKKSLDLFNSAEVHALLKS